MKKIKRPKKKVDKQTSIQIEIPEFSAPGYFSCYHNEAFSAFHIYQFVYAKGLIDQWDSNDDLNHVIRDCAKLSLSQINERNMQYDVDLLGFLLAQNFNHLQLVNQHLVNKYIFPFATILISQFTQINVIDYEGYQNIEDRLDGLPDEIAIVIQERLDKPMLISGFEQQQYITRLSAVVASELKYCDIDEFERHLSDVNQFVIMLTGTRISLQPTTH